MRFFEWIYRWLAERLAPYLILYLQVGGHCGLCGKWVPDVIVERGWSWTLCDKCAKGGDCLETEKVKIFCHSCEGDGYVIEHEYLTNDEVRVKCPECDGAGWIWDEKIVRS